MESIFRNLVSFDFCSICKKIVDDQRILLCGHGFCLKCLDSSMPSKDDEPLTEPRCPTCKVVFQIPEGGLKDLNKYEVLGSLVVSSRNCDICSDNVAMHFCIECSYNYCASCVQVHEKLPATRYHHLESIDKQASRKDKLNDNVNCEEHFKIVNSFCKDCNVFLCDQCPELKHKGHNIELIKEFFNSIRISLERNLKIKLEAMANVVSNCKVVEDVMWENKMEAENLRELIKGRGEEVKKAVDMIVAGLIQNVDEELKRHQFEADCVTMELDNLKANLNVQIKTLMEQLDDMAYENVAYRPLPIKDGFVNIPQYSKYFNTFFLFAGDNLVGDLKKMVGTLRTEPKFNLIEESRLNGKIVGRANSFAVSRNQTFTCNWEESRIDAFKGTTLELSYDFKKKLTQVHDMLVSGEDLFVLGKCGILGNCVVKMKASFDDRPQVIYSMSNWENICCLSESLSGKLLLVLSKKLLHLSENGDVVKTVDLSFDIYDALQIDETRYIVCRRDEKVWIVDDDGNEIAKYSDKKQLQSPYRLAKDNYGYIFLTDYFSKSILVLDQGLNYILSRDVGEYLFKILYDKEKDLLLALSNCNKLMTFEL